MQPGSIPLTLLDALDRGLKYNLGLLLSNQSTLAARGARLRALADLLPNINGHVNETVQQTNLAALGVSIPGFPTVVGPFSVFDARLRASQPVVDIKAWQNERAANQNVEAAKFSYQNARDLVVLVVGASYLQAIANGSRVDAARAELATAQTLYRQAVDMKAAGVVPAIEVLRAQVQMQERQLRVLVAENDFAKQKLALARTIGLPEAQQFDLADKIPYAPAPPLQLETEIQRALERRPDYKQLQAQVNAAEYTLKAARSTYLPSLSANGDYGDIGRTPGNSHGTFTATAALRFPIFQGGRIRGEIQQAEAALAQRKAQLDDLRGSIEHDVRTAFLDLNAAAQQVEVAQSSLDVARQQLTQSQDRFAAGVTSNIEVVQAQEAEATAEENFISSLYAHNFAKLSLARAVGVAEDATRRFLGGK